MSYSATQLNTIYQNVLFRPVDISGINAYANSSTSTDAQVRQAIETSSEAQANVFPIVRLYEAAFGSVPDINGLSVNVRTFESNVANNGNNLQAYQGALNTLAQSFANSPEFTQTYGAGVSANLIQQLYRQTFQRDASPAEIAQRLANGQNAGQQLLDIANSPEAQQREAAFVTSFLDGAAQGSPATGGSIFNPTGGSTTSPTSGQSFVFTTGVDSLTGTGSDDTFTADNTQAAKQLSTADSVNGGAGNDTLRVFLAMTDATVPLPSTLTSVETVATNGGIVTGLNVANLAGVLAVQVDAPVANTAETITINNQTVTLSNFATTANTTTTIASTNDTAETVVLSKFAATAGVNTLDLSGTKVTTLNLSSIGGANALTLTDSGGALTTLNITGDQKLTLTENLAGLKTISGSAATGSITVDTSTLVANNNITFTGGSAADSIKFGVGQLTNADVLDGGAGTDTLIISDTAPNYAGINAAKNFEILGLGVSGATVDASQITNGIKEFSISAALVAPAVTITETITGLGAGSIVDLNVAATTVTLSGVVGNSAVSVNVGTATAAGFITTSLDTSALQTVNLNVLGTSLETITTLNNADNSSIKITGSTGLTITNPLAAGATGSAVDASALTGKLTIIGSGQADVITAGSGGSTITGGNGADVLTGGAGSDKFVYTTLTQSLATNGSTTNDTVNSFVAGSDKFQVAAAPAAVQQGAAFTTAGTGNLSTDIGTAIANGTATFAANNVAVVTITGTNAGTYAVLNDGNAGYQQAADAVIKLIGLTGTLAITDFTTA